MVSGFGQKHFGVNLNWFHIGFQDKILFNNQEKINYFYVVFVSYLSAVQKTSS